MNGRQKVQLEAKLDRRPGGSQLITREDEDERFTTFFERLDQHSWHICMAKF